MESIEGPDGTDPTFIPGDIFDDGWTSDLDVFLEEAFLSIANIYDTSMSIKAGRMFINFGDNPEAEDFNRFWGGSLWFGDGNAASPTDISQMGTWEIDPFDAVLLEWDFDAAVIDAFYAQAVDDPFETNADASTWAINASYIGLEGHQFDAYFAFNNADYSEYFGGGDVEAFLVGIRAAGDILPEELSYKAEVAYNFGDIDDGGALIPGFGGLMTIGDGDIEGFAAEAGLNYHPEVDYSPEIGFIYTWLQGDDDNCGIAQDEDFEGAFLPFEAKTYGQIADSFVFTNAHIFHLTGGVEFNEQWGLDADWYYFLLDEDEDISQPELTGFRGWGAAEDDDLGFELDVQLNYAFNESLGTFVGGGIFWPGDAIEEMSPTGDDDEAFFIRTGVKVAF
ncbi:MAG TPA: alginate export family protein [bacterium]|nr:alginate export family protein [bacterium]